MALLEVARQDDATWGTCYHPSHNTPITVGGHILTAAEKTQCEGKLVARAGDTVISNCNHTGEIYEGSKTKVYCEGALVARKTDRFTGYYIGEITGSADKTFAS